MERMKRVICLCLAVVLIACVLAGCGGEKVVQNTTAGETKAAATAAATQAKEPVGMSMITMSHPSFPYNENWWVYKAVEKKFNVKLKVTAVQNENYSEKFNITMASGDIPDLLVVQSVKDGLKYGNQGALYDFNTVLDKMPNFKSFIASNQGLMSRFITSDNKLYSLPSLGMGETERRFWFYRSDIFKANNISVPTTTDELYAALVKLKGIYPDSYPLCIRTFWEKLDIMASQWKTAGEMGFDRSTNKFYNGPITDNYKVMVEFLRKLIAEKLMPPDTFTLQTKQWENLMATSQSFITFDYISRLDFFNNGVDQEGFKVEYMNPVAAPNGEQKLAYSTLLANSLAVGSNTKILDKIIELVEFMYTEEGKEFFSWGIEGETFKVENGEKKFIDCASVPDVRTKYGLSTSGTYCLFDYSSHMSLFSEEIKDAYNLAPKYDNGLDPLPAFTDKEISDIYDMIYPNIKKIRDEYIAKFILGTSGMDEWDKFKDAVNQAGIDKIVELYNTAYSRMKK